MARLLKRWINGLNEIALLGIFLIFFGLILLSGILVYLVLNPLTSDSEEGDATIVAEVVVGEATATEAPTATPTPQPAATEVITGGEVASELGSTSFGLPTHASLIFAMGGGSIPIETGPISADEGFDGDAAFLGEAKLIAGTAFHPVIRLPFDTPQDILDELSSFSGSELVIELADHASGRRQFEIVEVSNYEHSERAGYLEQTTPGLTLVWRDLSKGENAPLQVANGVYLFQIGSDLAVEPIPITATGALEDVKISVIDGPLIDQSDNTPAGFYDLSLTTRISTDSSDPVDLGLVSAWLTDDFGTTYYPFRGEENSGYIQLQGTITQTTTPTHTLRYQLPIDLETSNLYQRFERVDSPAQLAFEIPYGPLAAASIFYEIDIRSVDLIENGDKLVIYFAIENTGADLITIERNDVRLLEYSSKAQLNLIGALPQRFPWTIEVDRGDLFELTYEMLPMEQVVFCLLDNQYLFEFGALLEEPLPIDCNGSQQAASGADGQ